VEFPEVVQLRPEAGGVSSGATAVATGATDRGLGTPEYPGDDLVSTREREEAGIGTGADDLLAEVTDRVVADRADEGARCDGFRIRCEDHARPHGLFNVVSPHDRGKDHDQRRQDPKP
jgi:hypothetical protein